MAMSKETRQVIIEGRLQSTARRHLQLEEMMAVATSGWSAGLSYESVQNLGILGTKGACFGPCSDPPA